VNAVRRAIAELVSCWLTHRARRRAGTLSAVRKSADLLCTTLVVHRLVEHKIQSRALDVALHWAKYKTISARKMVRLIEAYDEVFKT
jgi:hypothetical protein